MPRHKKTEIIRVEPQADPATLDLLIQKRVAEALASQTAILEPWFKNRAIANEIRRHQSIFQKRKWSLYYEKWGCLICDAKGRPHASHGLCPTCQQRLLERLKLIEKEYGKAHPQEYENQQIDALTSRIRNAQKILGR